MAREYTAGATCRELAAKYGCSTTGVLSALRRQGVPQRTTKEARQLRSRWGPEVEDEALDLYRQGRSVKQLARHYGTRDSEITALLSRRNEPLHPGGRDHPRFRSLEQCREVARLYEEGADLDALSERFGCTPPTVAKAIRKAGGTVRSGRPLFWTAERLATLADLHSKGLSQKAIGDAMGVSQPTIGVRLREEGLIEPSQRPRGPGSPRWKGGRHVRTSGYVFVQAQEDDLPFCRPGSTGYVMEHRLVMGRSLGRALRPDESVHHINGQRADNALSNLQLRQGKHGKGVVMTCNACGSHDVSAAEIAVS